jgi:F-type H+-transporting ATPase subunit delta
MARFRALPYAKALHQVVAADAPDTAEAMIGELERVAEALDAVPDFHRVLVTPVVAVETKTKILDDVLDTLAVSPLTRRFVHVVQQHYRMQHMRSIAETFRDLVDRDLGRVRARVEIAGADEPDTRRQITTILGEVFGTTVIADFEQTPELLAGFRVQVGSKVFDGSLIGQLDQLSRQIEVEQG